MIETKTTIEKIKVMQAFVAGKSIKMTDKDSGTSNVYNIRDFKELAWDWMLYDYDIDRLKFRTVGYANTMKGMVRNNKVFASEDAARMNRHSEDDRVGVCVNVTFEEVL